MFSAAEVKKLKTLDNQEQVIAVQISKLEGKLKNINKDHTPPRSKSAKSLGRK
jgi:hypothetical protein